MKQVVRTMVVMLLLASLNLSSAMAQYVSSDVNQFLDDEAKIVQTRGQHYVDVGRGLLFTGVSLAATALTTYLYAMRNYEPNPEIPGSGAAEALTVLTMGAGGLLALISTPIFATAYKDNLASGVGPLFYDGDNRGFAGFMEVGTGVPCWLTLDAIGGYYVTNNIFLGAGAGAKLILLDAALPEDRILPIYANARFAWGKRRVTPYFSGSFGYDIAGRDTYTAFEFGTRCRRLKNIDNSLWIGLRSEFRGADECCGLSLKFGWSF